MNIDYLVKEHIDIWERCETFLPKLGEEISGEDKKQREERLIQFSKAIKNEADKKMMFSSKREQIELKVKSTFGSFFQNLFNFSQGEASIITNMGFSGATKKFMKMARRFDPEVNMDDVFQASRNLWIINSLQVMMGEPVVVTPAMFAYSMLYPYSDNYIDDPKISTLQKIEFSKRFRLRLQGEEVIPANDREKTIFDLVSLIEGDWDRIKFPKVYNSLLAIHDAQTKSIFLINKGYELTYNDLLTICIEKGGTSVLADGYLINGNLSPEQEKFCFGFGTYLQFIDDIQDLSEDHKDNLTTLFTYAGTKGVLDEYTNRTIWFTNKVMEDLSCFEADKCTEMKGLMTKSVNFMLTEAVGINNIWFDNAFVDKVERYSPLSFEFVRKRRNHMDENRISLMKKIESFVFDKNAIAMQG